MSLDPPASSFRWPVCSLDFEASGLSHASYPIEVGVAVWRTPSSPIESWSTLIRPLPEWARRGEWSSKSQRVHSITAKDLLGGASPVDAMAAVDALVGIGGVAFCDGGQHDGHWLTRLRMASRASPLFALADWNMLWSAFSPSTLARVRSYLHSTPPPHRAGPDAIINLRAFAFALGVEQLDVLPIDDPVAPAAARAA